MSLWAIIPVKPLRRGKSRLAGVLTEDQRAELNELMLKHTLTTLRGSKMIDEILVISRDPAALALARDFKARTVKEDGAPELNTALKRATTVAQVYSIQQVLILPADLPLLTVADIEAFISNAGGPPSVVISPDRRADGTNALLLNPPGLIEYCYGKGSFIRHLRQARQLGIIPKVCPMETIMLDLDLPEDLELLRKLELTKIDQKMAE